MVQAKPNFQPIKITDDEKKLELAIQDKRLIHSTEVELKECLRYVYALVGLRGQNFPAGELKVFLHGFIVQNYGGHTAAEIRLAFEMAVTGKLDVDPVCYENFSPVYFAGIMNAFRTWASEQVRMLEKTKPPVEKVLTADEKLKITCEYVAYKQKLINKLPCTFERLIENKKNNAKG